VTGRVDHSWSVDSYGDDGGQDGLGLISGGCGGLPQQVDLMREEDKGGVGGPIELGSPF